MNGTINKSCKESFLSQEMACLILSDMYKYNSNKWAEFGLADLETAQKGFPSTI